MRDPPRPTDFQQSQLFYLPKMEIKQAHLVIYPETIMPIYMTIKANSLLTIHSFPLAFVVLLQIPVWIPCFSFANQLEWT